MKDKRKGLIFELLLLEIKKVKFVSFFFRFLFEVALIWDWQDLTASRDRQNLGV
jgi:hypothetical protein